MILYEIQVKTKGGWVSIHPYEKPPYRFLTKGEAKATIKLIADPIPLDDYRIKEIHNISREAVKPNG